MDNLENALRNNCHPEKEKAAGVTLMPEIAELWGKGQYRRHAKQTKRIRKALSILNVIEEISRKFAKWKDCSSHDGETCGGMLAKTLGW